MKYYVVDLENWEWTECEDEADALHWAEETIQYYREECDPEWPMGVGDVLILYGERDPDIDDGYDGCKVIYKAEEVDKVEFSPEEAEENGYDYYCDYKMVKVVE